MVNESTIRHLFVAAAGVSPFYVWFFRAKMRTNDHPGWLEEHSERETIINGLEISVNRHLVIYRIEMFPQYSFLQEIYTTFGTFIKWIQSGGKKVFPITA
ncbi:hypothetical protein DMENIID0001_074760 [Sergentomyia squamirostris]